MFDLNSNNMELLNQLGVDGTQHGDGIEFGIEMKMEDIEETDGQQQRALV